MAANTLLQQLKAEVQNDSQNYLGSMVFDVLEDSGTPNYAKRNVTVAMDNYAGAKATIIDGDIYFTNSSGSANYGTSINLADSHDLYVSNGSGKILVDHKYNVTVIMLQSAGFIKVDISQVDFINTATALLLSANDCATGTLPIHTKFRQFLTPNSNCDGDITNIDWSALTKLNINSTRINGDITIPNTLTELRANYTQVAFSSVNVKTSNLTKVSVVSCPNVIGAIGNFANGKLTELNLRNSGVTGSVESYVEAEWAANRRAGNVELLVGSKTPLHDVAYDNKQLYVMFGASTVTIKETNSSGATLATYDGSSWTYA